MILLYPGSFNPVHNGHLRLAEYALAQTQAEELWFIVSPNNPLKAPHELWDEQLRFDLLQTATQGKENMCVRDVEFSLPRPSYTANTLRALSAAYPDKQFALLIGEDNMQGFYKWREYEWILEHYPIFVYPRKKTANMMSSPPMGGVRGGFNMLNNAPLCPISSTEIRAILQQDDWQQHPIIREWLPERVQAHLAKLTIKG